MLTAAKTQVWNCPALTANSFCRTLPQPQVTCKAEELHSRLANGFCTRNPRSEHTSPFTMPLKQWRSSLLEPDTHFPMLTPVEQKHQSHIVCVMQKPQASVYYLKCSSQRLCLTTPLSPQLFCHNTTSQLCFLKAFPTLPILFALLLSQIVPYHRYHIKHALASYHLGISH